MTYLFHDLIVLKSFEIFSTFEHIIMEIPPIQGANAKFQVRAIVDKLIPKCSSVTVIVQPSYRPRTDRISWLNEWNDDDTSPFKFVKTCSCKCARSGGARTAGCHLLYYVGTTNASLSFQQCTDVPSSQVSIHLLRLGLEDLVCDVLDTLPDPSRCSGAQRVPDSLSTSDFGKAYPTDAKEKEKAKKKRLQELGIEVKVKKRIKVVEDHYDDCGDDCIFSPRPR